LAPLILKPLILLNLLRHLSYLSLPWDLVFLNHLLVPLFLTPLKPLNLPRLLSYLNPP
jgi:hypothetical protein